MASGHKRVVRQTSVITMGCQLSPFTDWLFLCGSLHVVFNSFLPPDSRFGAEDHVISSGYRCYLCRWWCGLFFWRML